MIYVLYIKKLNMTKTESSTENHYVYVDIFQKHRLRVTLFHGALFGTGFVTDFFPPILQQHATPSACSYPSKD